MSPFVEALGHVNAGFNALSAVLIASGVYAIKTKRRTLHRNLMIASVASSALFLAGYLTRAAMHGTRAFEGTGAWRPIYFLVLIPHMLLAVAVVPLVLRLLWLAYHERFVEHRGLARWAYPIWLYVSVTGVIVYAMLYHWPSAA